MKKIGMNPKTIKALICALVVIVALIGGWWVWSISQTSEIDFYSCTQDPDCIRVKGGCCGCGMGGTATAINKKFEKEWQNKFSNECQGIGCKAVLSSHPSCFKEPKCVNNKCVLKQLTEQITVATDKTEYERSEEINASLSYNTTIYKWHNYGWSIQTWENGSWITIKGRGDPYLFCANIPACDEVNLEKVEQCPSTVLCERETWYKVTGTPELVWDQSYKTGEKTFQCKTGKPERIESWTCAVFDQVSSGRYKIRFEYALTTDPNDPFSRNVEIKYAEKELTIK